MKKLYLYCLNGIQTNQANWASQNDFFMKNSGRAIFFRIATLACYMGFWASDTLYLSLLRYVNYPYPYLHLSFVRIIESKAS